MSPTIHAMPGRRRALAALLLLAGLGIATGEAAAIPLSDVGGSYTGSWLNQTFGSTGAAQIDITIAGSDVSVVFDMDGFVFGQIDPPAIAMSGQLVGDTMTFASTGLGLFGDIAGSIAGSDGSFAFTLSTIPGGFISQVVVTGSLSTNAMGNLEMSLQYSVAFPGPQGPFNPAAGVLTAERLVPEPGTALLCGVGLVLLAGARRTSRSR